MKSRLLNREYKKDIKIFNSLDNPYVFESMFRGNPNIKEIHLHKETIYIEEKAFMNCVSLEKINIPPKVQYLTSKMFYGCVSLREITVESPVPPKYYPNHVCCLKDADDIFDYKTISICVRINNLFTEKPECFEGVNKQKCIIRVPKDCVELYRNAYEWKEFQYIVEL